jgi:hypothetical protein
MFEGFEGLMDLAMAQEIGVSVEDWIEVIENYCTYDEAEEIIAGLWEEDGDTEKSKELFNKKLAQFYQDQDN